MVERIDECLNYLKHHVSLTILMPFPSELASLTEFSDAFVRYSATSVTRSCTSSDISSV